MSRYGGQKTKYDHIALDLKYFMVGMRYSETLQMSQ